MIFPSSAQMVLKSVALVGVVNAVLCQHKVGDSMERRTSSTIQIRKPKNIDIAAEGCIACSRAKTELACFFEDSGDGEGGGGEERENDG